MTDQDLVYVLALQHVPKIGDLTAKKLINHCGSAEAVLKEKKQKLLKIDGVGEMMVKELFNSSNLKEAEQELQYIKESQINCLYFTDEYYPEKLKHCVDGPILLFQSGNVNLKNQRIIRQGNAFPLINSHVYSGFIRLISIIKLERLKLMISYSIN